MKITKAYLRNPSFAQEAVLHVESLPGLYFIVVSKTSPIIKKTSPVVKITLSEKAKELLDSYLAIYKKTTEDFFAIFVEDLEKTIWYKSNKCYIAKKQVDCYPDISLSIKDLLWAVNFQNMVCI